MKDNRIKFRELSDMTRLFSGLLEMDVIYFTPQLKMKDFKNKFCITKFFNMFNIFYHNVKNYFLKI